MYDSYDYLDENTLNSFESEILQLYENYKNILENNYISKMWQANEFVYVDDIKNVEDAIEYAGKKFDYPTGWLPSKKWNLEGVNNISYKDLNRWRNNLDLIYDKASKIELKYTAEFYSGEEVSL